MLCSQFTNMILITVMSVHSLFGSALQTIHQGCCQSVAAQGDCKKQGACACNRCSVCVHQHGKHDPDKHESHEHVCETVADNNPLGLPCDCQCEKDNCFFVQNAAKPLLVNRFSFEQAELILTDTDSALQLSATRFSLKTQKNDLAGLLSSCCAVTSVWRL